MIHSIFNLARPLIIFDTETTGTDRKNDRILELAFQLWTPRGLEKEFRTLINPCVPIPPEVTAIHGVKDDDFVNCRTCGTPLKDHPIGLAAEAIDYACKEPRGWPTFKQLAPSLAKGFSDCDYAGKNPRFDLQITASEMKRSDQAWSYAGARVIDIDRLEAWLNKRSLSHLHRKYVKITCPNCAGLGTVLEGHEQCFMCCGTGKIGKNLEGAHGALADVQGSTAIILAQMEQVTQNEDPVPLPRDLDALHALQWPGWIDSEGMFVFIKGVPCFGRWGKHAGKRMDHPDLLAKKRGETYYDFILKGDFSAEAKAIAAEAKAGRFPVAK